MKMMITPEWLRNRIENTPETDVEAGIPIEWLQSLDMFLPSELITSSEEDERIANIKHAFGVFIQGLRKKKMLTVELLAESALVDRSELRAIENDPHVNPNPRTIYQLANFFGIDKKKMMMLSGLTRTCDEEFEDKALKFAAKSEGVSSLNKEEQQVLNEYVKFLNGD